jgi:hypothetical protein
MSEQRIIRFMRIRTAMAVFSLLIVIGWLGCHGDQRASIWGWILPGEPPLNLIMPAGRSRSRSRRIGGEWLC